MEVFLCGTESSLNVADCVVELKLSIVNETDKVKWEKIHRGRIQWEESSGQSLSVT